jgi:hypothetical protein
MRAPIRVVGEGNIIAGVHSSRPGGGESHSTQSAKDWQFCNSVHYSITSVSCGPGAGGDVLWPDHMLIRSLAEQALLVRMPVFEFALHAV